MKDTPPIFLAVANTVAVSALPVTSPVTSPANNVAVNRPELELNVRLLPVSSALFPVAV